MHAFGVPTDEERERELRELLGRHLLPGVNFTTWPNLKWERAKGHLADLTATFDIWQASAPITIEGVLQDDDETVELIMRVPRGIPVHEWSLILGDAVHNLRSAFDAVAWGMANHNDAKPRNPRRVSFPVADDVDVWNRAVESWLGAIDPEHQQRIAIMQPYTFAAAGSETFLSVLTDLDNRDKHRNLISVSVDLHEVNLGGAFAYADPAAVALPELQMHDVTEVRDGAVVATFRAGAPLLRPVIFRQTPKCKMTLKHNSHTFDVTDFAAALLKETRRCLDMLIGGFETDGTVEASTWPPPPAATS